MALRATRQYVSVLGPGDGKIRVTRQYVCVLGTAFVFQGDVSDSVSVSDGLEAERISGGVTHNASASDSIAVGVQDFVFGTLPVEDSITAADYATCAFTKNVQCSDSAQVSDCVSRSRAKAIQGRGAGSYTAKEATPSTPYKPPGWGEWPWPGPFPPGYAPSLSLSLTAPEFVAPATPVSEITATLKDGPNQTAQPSTLITWTATWKDTGEPVDIRVSGGEFGGSASTVYANVGEFWGAEPTLEFPTTGSDTGRTIVLKAESTPFEGYASVDAEAEIRIAVCYEESCEEDCEGTEYSGCLPPCDNAVAGGLETTYIGAFTLTACRSGTVGGCSYVDRDAAIAAGNAAVAAISAWAAAQETYCDCIDAIEQYTCELGELQCKRSCRESNGGDTSDLDSAISDKQQQISDAEDARDEAYQEAQEQLGIMDAQAAISIEKVNAYAPESCQYLYSKDLGTEPCTNAGCDDLGPTCGGRSALRCRVFWRVQRKTTNYLCPAGVWEGDWQTVMAGGYTVSGKPYVTYAPMCGGIGYYACSSSPSCSIPGCKQTGWPCHNWYVYEVQVVKQFSDVTEEECCE